MLETCSRVGKCMKVSSERYPVERSIVLESCKMLLYIFLFLLIVIFSGNALKSPVVFQSKFRYKGRFRLVRQYDSAVASA